MSVRIFSRCSTTRLPEPDAKVQNLLEKRAFLGKKVKKVTRFLAKLKLNAYLCIVRMKFLATPLSAGSKALQILLHLNKKAASCMVRLFLLIPSRAYISFFVFAKFPHFLTF